MQYEILLSLVQQQDWETIAKNIDKDPTIIKLVLHMAFVEGKGVGMEQLKEMQRRYGCVITQ